MKSNQELIRHSFTHLAKNNLLLKKAIEQSDVNEVVSLIDQRDELLQFIASLEIKKQNFSTWSEIVEEADRLGESAILFLKKEKSRIKETVHLTKVSKKNIQGYNLKTLK